VESFVVERSVNPTQFVPIPHAHTFVYISHSIGI
jgi:hypothetical protein